MLKKALAGLAIIGIAAVAVVARAQGSFDAQVRAEVDALTRNVDGPSAEKLTYDKLAGLPEPVQRYFRASLREGTPYIRYAHLKQTGDLRPDQKTGWKPFRADQWYSVDSPGFIWQANMDFAPLVTVQGRDMYYQGQGHMLIKPLGLFAVVDARGPEMDVSSFIRYLSEMFWFPTALLPSERVQWSPVDANSAQVTSRDGDLTTTALVTFNESGEPVRLESRERYRTSGNEFSRDLWWGRLWGFEEAAPGVKIPTEAVVGWTLPEGEFEYVRLKITEVEYR